MKARYLTMKTDAFINVNITLNGKDDSVDLLNYADWDELKVDLRHIFNVKNVDGIAGVITKTSFGDMGGNVTLENAMNFLEYAYDNYDKDIIPYLHSEIGSTYIRVDGNKMKIDDGTKPIFIEKQN